MACNAIVNSLHSNNDTNHTTLNAIIAGASIYYNFSGKTSCLNLDSGDDIGADMWDYQVKLLFSTTEQVAFNFTIEHIFFVFSKKKSYFVVIFSNTLGFG